MDNYVHQQVVNFVCLPFSAGLSHLLMRAKRVNQNSKAAGFTTKNNELEEAKMICRNHKVG